MKIRLRSMYDNFPNQYGKSDKQINLYVDNNVYFMENTDRNEENAIALLVEPRAIIPQTYRYIERNHQKFKYVFSFDTEILKLPNAKRLIYGQITAEFPDAPKTKIMSMVASNKDMCKGHLQRRQVAQALTGTIDTFGTFNGGSYCDDAEYLSGYRFNVAMENYSNGYYFTEKICNCFASRIVPIYWGCPHIGEFFDMNGVLGCESPEEVIETAKRIMQNPIEEYEKRKDAIEANFQTVQKYRSYAKLFLETYADLLEEI